MSVQLTIEPPAEADEGNKNGRRSGELDCWVESMSSGLSTNGRSERASSVTTATSTLLVPSLWSILRAASTRSMALATHLRASHDTSKLSLNARARQLEGGNRKGDVHQDELDKMPGDDTRTVGAKVASAFSFFDNARHDLTSNVKRRPRESKNRTYSVLVACNAAVVPLWSGGTGSPARLHVSWSTSWICPRPGEVLTGLFLGLEATTVGETVPWGRTRELLDLRSEAISTAPRHHTSGQTHLTVVLFDDALPRRRRRPPLLSL
ncbi:hypothetical protein OF83DRAFT_1089374, partial [Amylostereum chailletii]